MYKSLSAAAVLTAASLAPLQAQTNSQCANQTFERARNVCDAGVDGARLFHPVVGLLVAGGNPALGAVAPLGGFPHASIGLRVNAVRVVTPDLNYNGNGRVVQADQSITAPAPSVEAAVGIFRGIGRGNLAVDALGAAQLLPTDQIDNVRVSDDARRVGSVALAFGYGARVTVLGGYGAAPAVSVSVMRRSIPRIDVGDVASGDRYAFGSDLDATSVRLVVGKTLGPLSVAAGIGRDRYTGDADITYRDPISDAIQPVVRIALKDTRSLGFLNAALSLGGIRLAAEIGQQQGSDLGLGTTFEQNDPSDGRLFGGVGLRVAF
ncbi:MAG: hypothetical protein H0W15_01275 [Gemmatimonadales bacterium]|nr:hypothetical protein [Gemmatimonadales bacterium]